MSFPAGKIGVQVVVQQVGPGGALVERDIVDIPTSPQRAKRTKGLYIALRNEARRWRDEHSEEKG